MIISLLFAILQNILGCDHFISFVFLMKCWLPASKALGWIIEYLVHCTIYLSVVTYTFFLFTPYRCHNWVYSSHFPCKGRWWTSGCMCWDQWSPSCYWI